MRIVIVSQYFWPESFRVNEVARDLARRGHRVTVLCGTPNYPTGRFPDGYGWFRRTRETWEDVEVVRVPVVPRGAGGKLLMALNYLSFAISATLLGPFRIRGPIDAILVYQMSPVLMGVPARWLAWLRDAPMHFWVQDLWPESLRATGAVRARWLIAAIDRLVGRLYRASQLVLIQSRAFEPHVVAHGVPTSRIRYLPNSAEGFYRPLPRAAAHDAWASVPDVTRILFAGNVGVAQDFPTVLRAAELTRDRSDLVWVVAGDGRELPWVRSEVRRLGLERSFHLLGRFPVTDMPALYAGADILLVTLKRDPIFELTIPSKVQSCLASARPLLAALDGEGARIIREAEAGLTGPAQDHEALAASARALADLTPERRGEMGWRGRAYFERHFEHGQHIDSLEAILKETLRDSRPGVRQDSG